MAVDYGNLSPELLDEFLQDHTTELAPLLSFQQWGDERPVTAREGKVYRYISPLELPTDGHRSSGVAPGSATPRRNVTFGTIDYNCELDYKIRRDIDENLRDQIETYDDISNKLIKASTMDVVADFVRDNIVPILNGSGLAGDDRDFTQQSLAGNAWDDGTPGNPTTDIDAVVKALRGGDLICVLGFDVAQALSRNPFVTGSDAGSGEEQVAFPEVIRYLQQRGIREVYIDATVEQATEGHYARSYGGLYDGIFAVFTRGNIIVPRLQDLVQRVWYDDDRDCWAYKAKHVRDARRAYAEHGYYIDALA